MELVLAAPGLLALPPEALAHESTLSRIAGAAAALVVDDLDRALLGALDVAAATAPLAMLGAGRQPAGRYVTRADPVTMRVTHDDVRIAARVDDLDAREVETLVTLLDAHFGAEGLAFHAPRADAWFATSESPQEIAMTPLDAAVGRTLRPCLPTGAGAARWRRWLNETQMLLHEHPLGARAHPVHGLWFSGGGMPATEPLELPRHAMFAAPGREGDVVRGLARAAGREASPYAGVGAALAAAGRPARVVIALPRVAPDGDASAACAPIAEALRALDRGPVERIELVADGRGASASWSIGKPSLRQRLMPRRALFVPPERPE
jgi:hypothetical protein